ncbi:MAG: tyrosine-type recombinase/integrase [Rikenellaceae bacterium]
MARSTFKILFYIDKNTVKADGTTAIKCRLSVDGKRSVLSTGLFCKPDDWNPKKESRELIKLRESIEKMYEMLLSTTGVVSAELLKNSINGVNSAPKYLLIAGEVERERLRLRSIEINSLSTYRQSNISQNNLREFLKTMGRDDILFSELTHEFGESYKLFLKRDHNRKSGYINHCLTWLNRLIYIAVDKDVLRCNPLEDVAYEKKERPKVPHLTREELQRIMDTPSQFAKQELVRRAFIFSCFAGGLAYVDVFGLYPHHIKETSEGRRYIRINRAKTSIEAFIPLHPIAEQILALYNTTDPKRPIFPLPVREMVWCDLQEIAFMAGIPRGISYHQSRHSFGTLMLDAGIPIESVSKMMGHTNISSTQVYAKITDEKISNEMDMLMERRKQDSLNN